uniref:Aminotransferase-like plant mobile domain-containing protein n=1 Tax=Oryza punctata TaxID=4537 RepID=A0A0E0L2Z4_ORYPU
MAEMSAFRVYFGEGEIMENESGVDLSNFRQCTLYHPNPDTLTMPEVWQKRQADNRYRRSMHLRMTPWIEAWSQALNDVVYETRAYDHNTYEQYMAWYSSQTRIRLFAPEDPDERVRSTSVREAPTIPTIPEITQMSERLGGFGPTQGTSQGIPTIPRVEAEYIGQGGFTSLGGPTQSVPLHAPTYGTNPWQGQSIDYGGMHNHHYVYTYIDGTFLPYMTPTSTNDNSSVTFYMDARHVIWCWSTGLYGLVATRQKRQADNRYRRSMHLRMTPWIEAWSQALNDVVYETRAYDHNTYEQYMAWYSSQTRIRLFAPEDPDERVRSTSVREAPTIPTIPEITQMSERLGGFGPTQGTSQGIPTIPRVEAEYIGQGGFTSLGGPTQSVPLHAPTYGTNPWQGQSIDYGGSFRPELMAGFRPYTASYGDMSSFGGGSSSVPNEFRASQTDDAPQMTQPTQPDDGDLQGNDNDPRRSNRERHEPNHLSLSGPRHAAGRRKKTTSMRADTSRTMTDHDDE